MMSKHEFYCQCEMKKKIDDHSCKIDVAWIPAKFAKINNWIRIKQDNGTWEDGWQVTYVGGKQKAEIVEGRERDYLNQRKVSDV
jgi:hypothetical protein